MRGKTTALVALGLVAGCGGPDPAASSFALSTSGAPPVPSTTPDAGTSTTTTTDPGSSGSPDAEASTSSTGEDGTTDPLRDLGSVDFGDAKPAGCKGKIDFLFMISRRVTMDNIQERMIAAFPAFIETIEAKFADFDYHIMIVDSDPYWGHEGCNNDCSPDACPVADIRARWSGRCRRARRRSAPGPCFQRVTTRRTRRAR